MAKHDHGNRVYGPSMATIRKRERKDGSAIHQVRWLQGGRGGSWESESFEDSGQAETFRQLVDLHGQQWPPGWVKGRGFVEPDEVPGDMPWLDWCNRYVDRITGVDERTRDDYRREIRLHLSLMRHRTRTGDERPPTIGTITADDVQDWVRAEEAGERHPDGGDRWLRAPADPKSVRNRHSLMWCIVQAAVEAEPPLRTRNCCKGTRLPRLDHGTEEDMCFLERDEYQRIAREIKDPAARDLADWLVGTGMRWGEATALQVRDFNLSASPPTVSVQRAWKKAPAGDPRGAFFLGPPKTRKARRTLALTPDQADLARRITKGLLPEQLAFRTMEGGRWWHANYHKRKWLPAVNAAVSKGLPRRPRIHDLRHTHVAWLIAARIPLPAIQVRLGHESITTTVDRYGHLVRELDAEIVAAVAAALPGPEAGSGGLEGGLRVVS